MSDADYLKCDCQKCGGSIEFPASGAGEVVGCPHCGEQTKLISMPLKSGRKFAITAGSILFVLIVVSAVAIFYRLQTHQTKLPSSLGPLTVTNAPIPKAWRETNDFKIGTITLKKTEGSGLVYAVGIVSNDTDRQRFGVKIELDVVDALDAKIGDASDYLAVLEPHKEWEFHALLIETNALKARLANIQEQK